MRRTILGIVGLVVATVVAGGIYMRRDQDKPQGGAFYRITVDLAHDGEPIHVEVVVACHLTLSRAPAGSVSVDNLNSHPYAYAMAIPGGHAVAVRTNTKSCETQATTENGQIPKNWLPLVVWYEHAEDLSFGVGYLTQDAYESPLAQLEFRGAIVTKATWADYQTFERDRPKNLLPEHTIYSGLRPPPPLPTDTTALVEEPWRAWRYSYGAVCRGVQRIPLTERQKEIVHGLRPANSASIWTIPLPDQPALWSQLFFGPSNSEYMNYSAILGRADRLSLQVYDTTPDRSQTISYLEEAASSDDVRRYRPQVFPMRITWGLSSIRQTLRERQRPAFELAIGDGRQLRGFVYCDHVPTDDLWDALDIGGYLRASLRMLPRRSGTIQCKIDGYSLADEPSRSARLRYDACWKRQDVAFELGDFALVGINDIGL